ncbi:MAG: methyltransferase domain-containing protein [Candidatus Eremiobacteraeota bacterium]|nr:methyltransferase domain-containing protein [Candidatus Eremiobacteraeota bacterium]MBV8222219.1 methyltransferase domain-containing protein [Candidatus Eremiobacteraeota bacterium]MBV8280818.1 methyltransferase domain-containing protein [Candidatus Eremiobacteraeota bacterium]
MDKSPILERVQSQFSATAQRYVDSPRHATGDDLERLVELAQLRGTERVLDVATGGGHTALAFAPHAADVVASDLTPRMLEVAAELAASRGVDNVRFVRAQAESLPFDDASFDVVTCRVAPHHFADPAAFVREVARVLRPGGRFLLDDQMAPEDRELDQFVNTFERWRDPSHVRAYTPSEWRAWIAEAGLTVERVEDFDRDSYDFADWTARSNMPEADRDALERWLLAAPPRCAEFFRIVWSDGHVRSLRACFAIIVARKPEEES